MITKEKEKDSFVILPKCGCACEEGLGKSCHLGNSFEPGNSFEASYLNEYNLHCCHPAWKFSHLIQ